jgi:hypothetical protein
MRMTLAVACPERKCSFVHPERGARRYEYATFQANDDPALKLSIYTPV